MTRRYFSRRLIFWLPPVLILGVLLSPLPPFRAQKVLTQTQVQEGTQTIVNGRSYPIAWGQWRHGEASPQIGISATGLMNRLGFDLQNTADPDQQPVQWFSDQVPFLPARLSTTGEYRYLDITDFAKQANWQLQVQGGTLQIKTPASRINSLRLSRQSWGIRIVAELDRPTPWRISRLTNSRNGITPRSLTLSLDATLDAKLAKQIKAPAGSAIRNLGIDTELGKTSLSATIAGTLSPRLSMLTNPYRLVLDLRPDAAPQRNITWAPGLRWREQTVNVGSRYYPVTWLEIDPRQTSLKVQPVWSNPSTLVGTQPLAVIAQRWRAAAVINGGFFNRAKQFPLGAIRQDGNWISSPILNRGAIAWNNQGDFRVSRLTLQQTLISDRGQQLVLSSLDSGFVQKGIARYTRNWGPTYTPQVKIETVVTVNNNQVVRQQSASSDRPTPISIPADGYLLVFRGVEGEQALAPGTTLEIQSASVPPDFNAFPNILGAGPMLLEQGRVVLDASAEQFNRGLDAELAPRSGIARTAAGQVLLVTTHNRVGGPGPSLAEWARILQQMGAVDALNLDGGSSTALYLGGELLDRHPTTTTRVQNGIGIFLQPVAQVGGTLNPVGGSSSGDDIPPQQR
jgi:hypothetical protein